MKRPSALAALALTGAMMLLTLTSCAAVQKTAEAPELEVHFFDAGKADAILLTTAGGTVLVDAGEKGFGKTILAYLEEKGVEKIDCLIITHFDQDHVGGAAKVLNNIAVGTVLQNDRTKDSEEYEKYLKALENAGIEPTTVRETYSFTLDGVEYTVDPPRESEYSTDDSNNASLIVSVKNGEHRFLLAGDALTDRLGEFLDGNGASYDVLKVAHHGKEEPLLPQLVQSIAPSYAVITSSDKEPESESAVETLEAAGVEVLLTREGAVTFFSDGKTLTQRRR